MAHPLAGRVPLKLVVLCLYVSLDPVPSRCLIFSRQPAKMAHLSAGGVPLELVVLCVHESCSVCKGML